VAAQAGCDERLMFVPQDESSAWAWLPLGGRHDVALSEVSVKGMAGGDRIQFAFGEPGLGVAGFRRTHQQAVSAQAVALAAGPAAPPVTAFAEVAPLALMSGSLELLRAWVAETLGPLAGDDDHNARLRDTLASSCRRTGATSPPRSVWSCTRTRSSTGCARPRRACDVRSARIGCASSWRCWPRSGSARPCCGRSAARPRPVP
jgi:hypothetical protein